GGDRQSHCLAPRRATVALGPRPCDAAAPAAHPSLPDLRMSRPRAQRFWSKILFAALGALLSLGLASTAFFRWSLGRSGLSMVPRFPLAAFVQHLPDHLRWVIPYALLSASVIPLRALQ